MPAERVLKIRVTAAGEVTADGEPVTVDELAVMMLGLKDAGGAVWYYRENPEGEPHPNAMRVIELVTEHHLPVRLSTSPDFEDGAEEVGAEKRSGCLGAVLLLLSAGALVGEFAFGL